MCLIAPQLFVKGCFRNGLRRVEPDETGGAEAVDGWQACKLSFYCYIYPGIAFGESGLSVSPAEFL